MDTSQMHVNRVFAARTADTSEAAVANLGRTDITLPKPVDAGDTLWAESEVTAVGVNQPAEVVIE